MHNFRNVLLTTLAFLLVVLLLSVGLMEIYIQSGRHSFQDKADRDALAGSVDYLICGASHAYRAFDPTVIDPILGTNGYNLSGALMTMGGRYALIRAETERNPVRTLVLEVSYNTMTRNRAKEGVEGDLYVLPRLSRFTQRLGFFFSAFSVGEYPDVYYKYVSEGVNVVFDSVKGTFRRDDQNRRRGYLPTGEGSYAFTDDYAGIYRSRAGWLSREIDPYNTNWLDRIVALCRAQGIELVLVTTPLSKEFLCRYADFEVYHDWYCDYCARNGLQYYDFNLYKDKDALLPDATMFYDELHLNDAGAACFSSLFAELMRRAQAGEDLSGLFYGSYAEMEAAPGYLD